MAASLYSKHVGGRQSRNMPRHEYLVRARELAPRGQDLPHAKLLDMDVVDIRSAHRQRLKLLQYIRENLSNEALAKRHGIGTSTVEKIVTYQTWSHIA